MEKVSNDPASFDIVIIGTPEWNRRMSTPIRTYITEYKDRFRKVAFFCTYQYTDKDPFEEMELLCGKKPVSTLKLHRKKEVEVDQYIEKTEEFIGRLAS